MAYIYKITNVINNKVYIGKTLRSPKKRWQEHCRDSRRKITAHRLFYQDINKYGKDNFLLETIESCDNNIADDREIYWIKYYDSTNKGYNMSLGGKGKHYIDYDKILELWNKGYTNKQICEEICCDGHTVQMALKSNNISSKERQKRGYSTICRSVAMINVNTNEIIKLFDSIQKAYDFLDKQNSGHIFEVCTGKRKTAYGYKWKFV